MLYARSTNIPQHHLFIHCWCTHSREHQQLCEFVRQCNDPKVAGFRWQIKTSEAETMPRGNYVDGGGIVMLCE